MGLITEALASDNSIEEAIEKNINIILNRCPVRAPKDIQECCESKDFLGIIFRSKVQKQMVYEFYEMGEDKQRKYNTLVGVIGQRAGKSYVSASILAAETIMWLSHENPHEFYNDRYSAIDPETKQKIMAISDNQMVTAQIAASTLSQSEETIFGCFITNFLKGSPWFIKYINWLKDREEKHELISLEYEDEESSEVKVVKRKAVKGDLFVEGSKIKFPERKWQIFPVSSNSASAAGKTSKIVLFDEVGRMMLSEISGHGTYGRLSAQMLISTLSNATRTFKRDGLKVSVSSPIFDEDYVMQMLYRCEKLNLSPDSETVMSSLIAEKRKFLNIRPDKTAIGFHGPSWWMNPLLDKDKDFPEKDSNPEIFQRDFMGIPLSALNAFFSTPEKIDECINQKRTAVAVYEDKVVEEKLIQNGNLEKTTVYMTKESIAINRQSNNFQYEYFIHCDAGKAFDSFALAMGHPEIIETPMEFKDDDGNIKKMMRRTYRTVYDLFLEWKPIQEKKIIISFNNVEKVVFELCRTFNVKKVTWDRWQSEKMEQNLRSHGILSEGKSVAYEDYLEYRRRIYSGLVEFYNYATVAPYSTTMKQLKELNDIKGKKVNHPESGHDDLAYCACAIDSHVIAYEKTKKTKDEIIIDNPQIGTLNASAFAKNLQYAEENDDMWGSGNPILNNIQIRDTGW